METYQGILREGRIEWSGEAPKLPAHHQGVRVQVTLLERVEEVQEGGTQGQRMAAALERVAAACSLVGIPDPAAWEREVREDRPLPGRDG